jgi:hypothetical protein
LLHVAAVPFGVSESPPVELNGESVHAVDAPASFTAGGPFHLELSNAGGAVRAHVRLDEELSAAVRLRAVNHYVETGETVRVPVGSVPGHLDVVSGYGAEREGDERGLRGHRRRRMERLG